MKKFKLRKIIPIIMSAALALNSVCGGFFANGSVAEAAAEGEENGLVEIYTSDGAASPVKAVLIPETIADKDYNMATVSLECASDTQFNEYCELSVVITVNGEEKTFSQKGTGGYEDAWKGSFDITDGISIKQGETYKVEAYTYAYGVKGKDYVYKASLLLSFQGFSGGDDNSGDDTDTSLAEIYTSDGADSPVKTVLIPETIADKDYNMATVSLECASDTQFNEYCELSVVITVNGEEKTFSQKGTGGYEDAWKGSFDITDGISIKQGETYKVEAYTYAYGVKGKDYVYKASLLLSFQGSSGGGDNSGDGDTQEPDRVQVDIKSSKLSFTYEKTGETDATFLKVSGMDVNGFNGNGTYEIDILESAWNTWDKTGYYNLGFVESDAAYTLKNVVVTVNGTYEFVLEEIKAASYKEDENLYKVDFINMWSGHKEGDVLYTSKDGKAALVSGGNTAVISLMVDKAAVPTPKPFLPPYAVTPPTTAPVATTAPTAAPTAAPTVAPTTAPTSVPTVNPTTVPTVTPVATVAPTKEPVTAPSSKPEEPSDKPDGANDIQKGDKVTVSGQKYEVTNNSKKTVAYVAAKGSKKASVSVPATVKVTVNGKKVTYKVTSIKDKAFKGNKKIKTITVSKNITSIGKDAFKNCGKLKTIVIKSTSITKVGKDALKGTAKNLVIKVPANKVSAYKKLFKNKGNNNIIVKKA